MDALKRAQSKLWEAQSAYDVSEAKDGNAFYRELSEMHYRHAAIYAAVAQAEQLKRIADALENWLSVQGVLPEFFEAVNRARNERSEQDDYGEEFRAERRQAQAFLAGTRRGMGLEE